MKLKPTKITIYLLVTILLMTSLGSAFGLVACDNGCFSEIHHDNHHVGKHNDEVEGPAEPHIPLLNASDDSCRDYLIQLSAGLFEQAESVKLPISAAIDSNPYPLLNSLPSLFNPVPYLESRIPISQTLLAHRTVVILR